MRQRTPQPNAPTTGSPAQPTVWELAGTHMPARPVADGQAAASAAKRLAPVIWGDDQGLAFAVANRVTREAWWRFVDPSIGRSFLGQWLHLARQSGAYGAIEDGMGGTVASLRTALSRPPDPAAKIAAGTVIAAGHMATFLQESGREADALRLAQEAWSTAEKWLSEARKKLAAVPTGAIADASTVQAVEAGTTATEFFAAAMASAGSAAALILLRNDKPAEARTYLQEPPELRDTARREDLRILSLEADVLEGAIPGNDIPSKAQRLASRLVEIDKGGAWEKRPEGRDIDSWCRKNYIHALWWAMAGGIPAGGAATERIAREKGRYEKMCLQKAADILRDAIQHVSGSQNKAPYLDCLGLLARVAATRRDAGWESVVLECGVWAWRIIASHFPDERPRAWRPLSGPWGRALADTIRAGAIRGIANPGDLPPDVLTVLLASMEKEETKEEILRARRKMDQEHQEGGEAETGGSPRFFVELHDRGVGGVLIVPLDRHGGRKGHPSGFGKAVPGASGFIGAKYREKRGAVSDRFTRDGEGARKVTETVADGFDDASLEALVRQCGGDGWSTVWLKKGGTGRATSTLAVGKILKLQSGASYAVVLDRPEGWTAAFDPATLAFAEELTNLHLAQKSRRDQEGALRTVARFTTDYAQQIGKILLQGGSPSEHVFGKKSLALDRAIGHEIDHISSPVESVLLGGEDPDDVRRGVAAAIETFKNLALATSLRPKNSHYGRPTKIAATSHEAERKDKPEACPEDEALRDVITALAERGHPKADTLADRKIGLSMEHHDRDVLLAWDEDVKKALRLVVVHLARWTHDGANILTSTSGTGALRTWTLSCPSDVPLSKEHAAGQELRGDYEKYSSGMGVHDVAKRTDNGGAHLFLARLLLRRAGGDLTVPPQSPGVSSVTVTLPIWRERDGR